MDGLFRSSATTRDEVRGRVLGLTAATALAALGAAGGLLVGLVPAHAGQPSPTGTTAPSDDPAPGDGAAPAPVEQTPVATSGGS